jgi:uncharacterized protein (UPF0303 family)
MNQPIEDRTYKQAIEQLAHRLEKETTEILTKSCEKFMAGSSLEESIAWIQDERIRNKTREHLVPMAIEVYLATMSSLKLLKEGTCEEMIAYLREKCGMQTSD